MTQIVLDCSMTVSWFLPDEASSVSQQCLSDVIEKGAIVPTLWPLEVGNALLIVQRRNRISAEYQAEVLETLNDLPIIQDKYTNQYSWGKTMDLAKWHQLSLYDASYLELAVRECLPLATLDKKLKKAARTMECKTIPEA